ncbi:hypothetical protein FAZ78_00420 [Cereibacter changlensis]|uniref:Uncharacterized protein n=1 Tax=Cereibacter changlensis TaxID=402884 RepID=A0A4U0Z2P9_9RHOB|nr:hypothetical protein [Cereibacter changlensis]TKA98555.1 hypothetical protein FAZ78_00420 [Cereibacter changlensis]
MMDQAQLTKLRREWPRVVRRASGGYQTLFTEKMARCLKNEAWRPSPNQLQLMLDMCSAYNAELPDIGEEMIRKRDGQVLTYAGAYVGWIEVRQ